MNPHLPYRRTAACSHVGDEPLLYFHDWQVLEQCDGVKPGSSIGAALGISEAAVTQSLERLLEHGLVRAEPISYGEFWHASQNHKGQSSTREQMAAMEAMAAGLATSLSGSIAQLEQSLLGALEKIHETAAASPAMTAATLQQTLPLLQAHAQASHGHSGAQGHHLSPLPTEAMLPPQAHPHPGAVAGAGSNSNSVSPSSGHAATATPAGNALPAGAGVGAASPAPQVVPSPAPTSTAKPAVPVSPPAARPPFIPSRVGIVSMRPATPAAPVPPGFSAPPQRTAPPTPALSAIRPPPRVAPRQPSPADGQKLKPLIDAIVAKAGGGTKGQLAVYRVFIKVPPDLLKANGVGKLSLVDHNAAIKDPELWETILRATQEVAGLEYTAR